MADLPKHIHAIKDAPPDSYVLLSMAGGIYYVHQNDYPAFSRFHCRFVVENYRKHLTMDLSFAKQHALLFDFDGSATDAAALNAHLVDIVIPVLRNYFLPLGNLMLIQARREKGGGMHVHLPEILIAHDDYIRLCSQLQPLLDTENIHLDIPNNWTLSKSSKVNGEAYVPKRIFYLDEGNDCSFEIDHQIGTDGSLRAGLLGFHTIKNKFKRRKDNSYSFFRKLLYLPKSEVILQIYEYMMPVSTPHKALHKISYPTFITKYEEMDCDKVARFWYREKDITFVHKGRELSLKGLHWMRSYYFLLYNAFNVTEFESDNLALRTWHRRCRERHSVLQDQFQTVNLAIKQDLYTFVDDANPIKTLLCHDNGYYFLPVFLALSRHLNMRSRTLIHHLRNVVDNDRLLDKLYDIDENLIDFLSQSLSLNTILYCGSNMGNRHDRMKDRISNIIQSMKGAIMTSSTTEQLLEHIRRIQERHFPILMLTMSNSCKKPVRYMWNPMNHCWQEVHAEYEVKNIFNTIYLSMRTFMKHNGASKEMNEMFARVNLQLMVSTILSETNNERKIIEMDRNKWFVRTEDGILDVLTGHVGATVPEFFISDRQMGIMFNRTKLESIRDDPQLVRLYRLLTDKSFFREYQLNLYNDLTDDVSETLRETVWVRDTVTKLEKSMLNFYVQLCKYTSFEYSRLMYMLDILASLLVATNYVRKFFIFKGVTRNGKSKFFQMISRAFGGYSHTIRSVNLQPSNGCSQTAQPELASTMFTCRIVAVEEMSGKLNENLVKELTGNSKTSFRNLYEQNTGGIPTAKIFASANTVPICIASEAFNDRVVVFPFDCVFDTKAGSLPTSQQVQLERFPLDTSDSLIEDSYEGLFIMIYLHLVFNMNMGEGTITYRAEPDSLLEFKEEFLKNTDIYTHFKIHADVQISPGHCTTLTDLKSAIRQFLKAIKNTSIEEEEIISKFDREFINLRRETDIEQSPLSLEDDAPLSFQNDAFAEPSSGGPSQEAEQSERRPEKRARQEEEDEEPLAKHFRTEESDAPQKSIIYYQNVVIKNLKKEKNNY